MAKNANSIAWKAAAANKAIATTWKASWQTSNQIAQAQRASTAAVWMKVGSSSWSKDVTSSQYSGVVAQAAKQWISADQVAATSNKLWLTAWGKTQNANWAEAVINNVYNPTTGKYESAAWTGTYQRATGTPIQTEWASNESPWPTGNLNAPETNWDQAAAASWWQEKAMTEPVWQHQQWVGWAAVAQWWAAGWQLNARQQAAQAKANGQMVYNSKTGTRDAVWQWWTVQWGNTTNVGNIQPAANDPLQAQTQQNKDNTLNDQNKINQISPDVSLWLTNSPDSVFWNKFWVEAQDTEAGLPWYMNERNKIIASNLMTNNPDMKYMSTAQRKDAIIKDIIDRQEFGIDPNIKDWYDKTATNINNLINKQIPEYTSNDYFNGLLNGETIPQTAWENPLYKQAKTRFNDLQKYSTMSVDWLTDSIEKWQLTQWSTTWKDLVNKGMWWLLDQAVSYANINTSSSLVSYVTNQVTWFNPDSSLESQWSNLASSINLGTWLESVITAKLLKTMTSDKLPTLASFLAANDEVQTAKTTARETETEINDLVDEIDNFADDIKTKVVEKWWEATDDPFLNAYIQEKTKPFTRKLTQLQGKYRNEIAVLWDLTDTATAEFGVKEYNKNMEIKWLEFVLGRLDQQYTRQTAAKAAELAQSNADRSFALQQQWFDLQKQQYNDQKANPNLQTVWYDDNGKPIQGYWKDWKIVTVSWLPWQTSSTPTWVQTGSNNRSSINYNWFDYKVW